MDAECQKCGSYYAVRENCEPTPFCDECAHGEVERLSALVDRLGNALQEQNERWGLYGNESQQALKAYEEGPAYGDRLTEINKKNTLTLEPESENEETRQIRNGEKHDHRSV